jgi:hypothetical protein
MLREFGFLDKDPSEFEDNLTNFKYKLSRANKKKKEIITQTTEDS